MSRKWTTTGLLIACLTIANCTPAGDFCEVVKGPLTFQPETAKQIVKTDRATAEQIETQNVYGDKVCKW